MKKLTLLFLIILSFATAIDKNLLLIEAKLYPKIALLINNLSEKEKIKIAIVANNKTLEIANEFKKFIANNNKFKVKIIKKIDLKYDVYILTYDIKKTILQMLISNRKIVFTIYPDKINHAMFSIYIGPRVYPYINPKLLKEAKIKINPIIFKVGKIYE